MVIENMIKWLIYQKNNSGDFGNNYTNSEVLKSFIKYIKYSPELKWVDFQAKWYLNSKEIISNKFDDSNKFSIINKNFKLKDYLKFWEDNSIWFEKTWSWKLYYDLWLRYFLPIEEIKARDEWIIIKRDYYNYRDYKDAFKKECIRPMWFGLWVYNRWYSKMWFPWNYCRNIQIKDIKSTKSWKKWDLLVGQVNIIVPSERNNVMANIFIPSGAHIVNINLDTTSSDIKDISWQSNSSYSNFSHIETRDDKVVLFANKLYAWTYKYTYVIKLDNIWKYHNRPAVVEEMKKPEIWGRTKGEWFEVR